MSHSVSFAEELERKEEIVAAYKGYKKWQAWSGVFITLVLLSSAGFLAFGFLDLWFAAAGCAVLACVMFWLCISLGGKAVDNEVRFLELEVIGFNNMRASLMKLGLSQKFADQVVHDVVDVMVLEVRKEREFTYENIKKRDAEPFPVSFIIDDQALACVVDIEVEEVEELPQLSSLSWLQPVMMTDLSEERSLSTEVAVQE